MKKVALTGAAISLWFEDVLPQLQASSGDSYSYYSGNSWGGIYQIQFPRIVVIGN